MVSNILPEEITSSLKRGQSQKPDKISKFYFVKLSCERAAEDVYIEWSHLQIVCTGPPYEAPSFAGIEKG